MSNFSGEVEWYTPGNYLAAVRKVFGAEIDLDPASSDAAQRHVGARNWYTVKDNGLAQRWYGRVFLNPPYMMPWIKRFVFRWCLAVTSGEVDEAILLTNNATDTEWFHRAAEVASAVCFTRGRIRFLEARNGQLVQRPANMVGQTFFYYGVHVNRFVQVFEEFGWTFPVVH